MPKHRKKHQLAEGYGDYEDRYDTTQELTWEIIEDMVYNFEQGRGEFPSFVLDTSDYTDGSAGKVDGTYKVCRLRPKYYDHLGKPSPCDFEDENLRKLCIAEHPEAISETMIGDTQNYVFNPGDVVTSYWEIPPESVGNMRVLRFYLDRVEADVEGNYDFNCLGRARPKRKLNYNAASFATSIASAAVIPGKACVGWNKSLDKYKGSFYKGASAIPSTYYNNTFSQIPNCYNCYRGGQFRKASYEAEIKALKERGIRKIYRFNKKQRPGEPTIAEEQAMAQKYQIEWEMLKLSGDTVPTPTQWNRMKDDFVKGGVYIHCHAGADRTGAITARWILETESALKNRPIDDELKQEVFDYTTRFFGAWKRPHHRKDPNKTNAGTGKRSRTSVKDSCANKSQKDWGFDIDTGYSDKVVAKGNKMNSMVPDVTRAKQASSKCPPSSPLGGR
tara:strand:- start:2448 stop:3785 length:1338 start_codon:yes stop_codon:yes gene_type:complete